MRLATTSRSLSGETMLEPMCICENGVGKAGERKKDFIRSCLKVREVGVHLVRGLEYTWIRSR